MDISKAFKSDRLLKSITGLGIKEFTELATKFEAMEQELNAKTKKVRQRAIGGGRKGVLKTAADRLFFCLLYLKIYPTFDLAGLLFNVNRSQPCRWIATLLPILEKVLGRACVLPKRQIQSIDEFLRTFPEVKDLFLDGTERQTQRPKIEKNQKRRYSGKKKRHTRKTLVGTDENRRIVLLSPTKNGLTMAK